MALPTPVEAIKGFFKGLGMLAFALLFALIFSSGVQWALLIIGAVLLFFKHIFIGTTLLVVAIIASFIRKSTRLFS